MTNVDLTKLSDALLNTFEHAVYIQTRHLDKDYISRMVEWIESKNLRMVDLGDALSGKVRNVVEDFDLLYDDVYQSMVIFNFKDADAALEFKLACG